MPVTLVELMNRINAERTAGYCPAAELTLCYGLPEQPKGPKEWRPNPPGGSWRLETGLSLQYRYMAGGERKRLPVFHGPCIRRLLEQMVEFFNSGPMWIYTPANSYGIDGHYELTERVELGEIPC
jgi:hypothetical protein